MHRIGILGGTFNPIHFGHLALAQAAQEKMKLDEVIFVPSALPPHKTSRGVAPAQDRLQMVRLAINGHDGFSVSDFEIKKGGKSYSIDTVRHFRAQYPADTKLYFVVGEDALVHLDAWKDIEELIQLVEFIGVNRPGVDVKTNKVFYHPVIMPGLEISSSLLRQYMTKGKSVQYFIPDKVLSYIQDKKLYNKSA